MNKFKNVKIANFVFLGNLANYVISQLCNWIITKIILYNLLGQSIRTSMQNLESVAQKMAELLHNYVIIT